MSNASAADKFIYDDVLEAEVIEKPFTSKEVQIVYDSNNGVYNNQILFSTGMMNSTGKWVDFQNSYIEVPFTMAIKSSVDVSAANVMNSFQMGLKDGSIQLVDSLILQYNGTSVIQNSIFTNIMQHFKILASWTQDDLVKWGPATVTYPDNTNSFRYSAVASAGGDGVSNNSIAPSVPSQAAWTNQNYSFNDGFLQRLRLTGFNPGSAVGGLLTETVATSQYIAKSFYTNNGAANAARVYYWQVVLTLRCKDLSDFFNKIPLMKSGRIDLTINFNSFTGTVTNTLAVANTTDTTLITASYSQLAGHCCPFMLANGAVPNGAQGSSIVQPLGTIVPAGTLTVGCGINGVAGVSALAGLSSTGAFANCRWYIPTFECDPVYEQQLLATNPIKTIYYEDFYTFSSIVNTSGTFSNLITAGVRNPQYVILFPFLNGAVGNSGNAMSNPPYQSMFDSAPGTTSPCSLTNFQVQCGGKTMFPLIEQYGYQQFFDEFSSIFALNGGKSDIVTSGLYSKYKWENAPIYVCNLSRRLPQDDGTAKSVQISATVNSKSPFGGAAANAAYLDIIVFVVYQRKCEFNLLNGLLVSDTL